MLICLNHRCRNVFEEDLLVDVVADQHPYGEGYVPEIRGACPACKCIEVAEAFQCEMCKEWYDKDLRRWHPLRDIELCEKCYKITEEMIERGYHHQTG